MASICTTGDNEDLYRKLDFSMIFWYKQHQLTSNDGIPTNIAQPIRKSHCLSVNVFNQSELNERELVSSLTALESK